MDSLERGKRKMFFVRLFRTAFFTAIPFILFHATTAPVEAQNPPPTAEEAEKSGSVSLVLSGPLQSDIYLTDFFVFEGLHYLSNLENITNRVTFYDNQPAFTPDSRSILYTAAYGDGNQEQTEIHRYYLSSRRITRITRTNESEYSATPIPNDRAITVVRVEADSVQHLWRMTLEGMDAELVLRDIAPVGYHVWGNEETVLLFILGNPPTLRVADVTNGQAQVVAENIGRSLHRIPNRNAWSFVQRVSDDEAWINEVNIGTREVSRIIRALDGGEFHAWTPEGVLLMASGGQIFQWDPELDRDWRRIANLNHMGLTFSRIAVSPDGTKIAIVGQPISESNPNP